MMDFAVELGRLLGEWETNGPTALTAEALGDLFTKKQDHVSARRWYRKALHLEPKKDHLLDKFEDSVIRVIEGATLRSCQQESKLTKLRLLHLQYTTRSYERRVRAMPSEGRLNFELGKLYYIGGQIDNAMSEFKKSLKHDHSRSSSYFYLARCLMTKRQFEEALLLLSRLEEDVVSGEIETEIKCQKGKCLEELGLSDEANGLLN
jgi:tetratricopeptide (TPR) repeat protein